MSDTEALALHFVPEERALFHLELLGAFTPDEAMPGPFMDEPDEPVYDDDEFDDEWSCTHCGGEGYREVDDIWWDDCDEFGQGPCTSCRGTGERRHQWVF
jgi:hypothetical protein